MSSLIEGYNFTKTQYFYHNTCAFIIIEICNATCTNNQIPQTLTIVSGFQGKFLLCWSQLHSIKQNIYTQQVGDFIFVAKNDM